MGRLRIVLCRSSMKSSSLQAKLFLVWYRLRYPIRGFIVIGFFVTGYLTWRNLALSKNVTEAEAIARMWKVVPKSVSNGETFTVARGDEEMKVKLCGVNAPSKDQPQGIEARDYLRSLLAKNKDAMVNITEIEKDRYGRTVAEVFVYLDANEHIHANTEMLSAGMAWHYKKYSKNCLSPDLLEVAEANARENKLGVFASNSKPPWEWRKAHK
jgi:endonuclease YncB( thermonuclease family)